MDRVGLDLYRGTQLNAVLATGVCITKSYIPVVASLHKHTLHLVVLLVFHIRSGT